IRERSGKYSYFFLLLLNDPDFENYYDDIRQKAELNANAGLGAALLKAFKCYKRLQPDIVHAHSFTPFIIACCFFWKSRLVFHVHNIYPYFRDNDLKSIFKRLILRVFLKSRRVKVLTVSREIEKVMTDNFHVSAQYLMNAIPTCYKKRPAFSEKRSSGRFYIVTEILDDSYVMIADGDIRRLKKPKKKKIKHLKATGEKSDKIREKLLDSKTIYDAEIYSIIRKYNS
ncbi:MAG: glycosyltransferase, partial [Bacillota bacterium]